MENGTESPPPKTPLRWYQYRLRTLLIIMTVLAAWMAMISHHARQQKLAVEKIHALGGTVLYDYQKMKGEPWNVFEVKDLPPGPGWLRKFIGEEYFQSVVQVDLRKTATTDDDLAILENLPGLEAIELEETRITSNGLAHLKGMRKLKSLSFWNTSVDDAGLIHLKNLTELRVLILDGTKITDAGTVHLQKLTNLEEWLGLADTQITDESLKYFKNFKKLRSLNLLRTKFTEQGAKELKKSLPKTNISYSQNGEDRMK